MVEVALAVLLLVGAGLFFRTLQGLSHVDKGFHAENVMSARLSYPVSYRDRERWLAFNRELLREADALPGVEHAALSLLIPLRGRSWERGALPDNRPLARDNTESMLFGVVSPDWFATMGAPIIQGRGFTEADNAEAQRVAVIDESMAKKFFPGENPIGRRVAFEWDMSDHDHPIPRWRTIIGVVRNVRHYTLTEPARIEGWIPMAQADQLWGVDQYLLLKTAGNPAALAEPIRRLVGDLDPLVPTYEVRPLQGYVADELQSPRAMTSLFGAFASSALLLAAIGIFGVVSFVVASRRREIGIRVALGATRGQVLQWAARQGLVPAAIGLGFGFAGALAMGRIVRGLLFGVAPVDPASYAAVAVLLLATTAIAVWVPTRRATRVEPMSVLREE